MSVEFRQSGYTKLLFIYLFIYPVLLSYNSEWNKLEFGILDSISTTVDWVNITFDRFLFIYLFYFIFIFTNADGFKSGAVKAN